jgi:hypothetical protein
MLDDSPHDDEKGPLAPVVEPELLRLPVAARAEVTGRFNILAADGFGIALYLFDRIG